jgi:hypothetical protein
MGDKSQRICQTACRRMSLAHVTSGHNLKEGGQRCHFLLTRKNKKWMGMGVDQGTIFLTFHKISIDVITISVDSFYCVTFGMYSVNMKKTCLWGRLLMTSCTFRFFTPIVARHCCHIITLMYSGLPLNI